MGFRETLDKIRHARFEDASAEERAAAARKVIGACALASGGLVLQPIPGLEQGVVVVQVGMVVALAHIHGRELSRKRAREIVMDLGAVTGVSVVGRQAATTLAKVLLPGLGGALAAPAAFAVTWATGHAADHYFKTGGRMDRERLKAIFDEEKKRARSAYSADRARAARPSAGDLNDADDPR